MKKVLTLLVLLLGFMVSAQNDALFNNATDSYNKGNYDKAAEQYLQIIENGQHSAALYFNLGNCYYKLNQVAPSIYYYEKALLLEPNNTEIRTNLGFAKNMTLDAIETLPESGFSKIRSSITGYLSFDQWAYLAVICSILFVIFYIAFYYFRYATKKRIAFILSLSSLFLSIIAIIFAFIEYNDFNADQPAIVFTDDEVIIKSEPNKRSQEVFRLHAGTKVNILEKLDNWKKIQIADGKTGWLSSEDVKLLKNF